MELATVASALAATKDWRGFTALLIMPDNNFTKL